MREDTGLTDMMGCGWASGPRRFEGTQHHISEDLNPHIAVPAPHLAKEICMCSTSPVDWIILRNTVTRPPVQISCRDVSLRCWIALLRMRHFADLHCHYLPVQLKVDIISAPKDILQLRFHRWMKINSWLCQAFIYSITTKCPP